MHRGSTCGRLGEAVPFHKKAGSFGDNKEAYEHFARLHSTLADGDGRFSDWIEIHNPSATPVNLDGWHLSDDRNDLAQLIDRVLGSTIGDSNLDGVFDSADFVQVFKAGKYEDRIRNNATWAEGDWNQDGDFDSGDLVYAFTHGKYSASAKQARNVAASIDVLFGEESDLDDNFTI